MDFSYILHSSIPQNDDLIKYGFNKTDDGYFLKKILNNDFYAVIYISQSKITAEVFENSTDDKYALLDVQSAQGAFVGGLREQVKNLIGVIKHNCFTSKDLKNQYVEWIEEEIGVKGDYPWEDDNNAAVYRCQNNKWFALIMKIKFKNLGFESDEPVWAVNLKADKEIIPQLVDNKSIFPAWHMNKKYWITVILTAVTDFEKLKELTLKSHSLVEKK